MARARATLVAAGDAGYAASTMRSALASLAALASRALLGLALASPVALVACAEPAVAPAVSPPSPSPPAPPSATPAAAPAPSLARSTATTPPPSDALELAVTRAGVRVSGADVLPVPAAPAWVDGFAVAHKRRGPHDLFLVPLGAAVGSARGPHTVATVSVAPEIPYRVLVEVLFTLAQSGVPKVAMLVTGAGGGLATIEHEAPRAAPGDLAAQAEAMAAELAVLGGGSRTAGAHAAPSGSPAFVTIARDGLTVRAGGVKLGPGCRGPGQGPTVPALPSSEQDWASLGRCAATLRAEAGAGDTITLTAAPDIDFQTVVSALDAVRPSFPRFVLGVPR